MIGSAGWPCGSSTRVRNQAGSSRLKSTQKGPKVIGVSAEGVNRCLRGERTAVENCNGFRKDGSLNMCDIVVRLVTRGRTPPHTSNHSIAPCKWVLRNANQL